MADKVSLELAKIKFLFNTSTASSPMATNNLSMTHSKFNQEFLTPSLHYHKNRHFQPSVLLVKLSKSEIERSTPNQNPIVKGDKNIKKQPDGTVSQPVTKPQKSGTVPDEVTKHQNSGVVSKVTKAQNLGTVSEPKLAKAQELCTVSEQEVTEPQILGTVSEPEVTKSQKLDTASEPEATEPQKLGTLAGSEVTKPQKLPIKRRIKRKKWSMVGHRCRWCPEIFDTDKKRNYHENKHTRPFHCSQCSKDFVTQRYLTDHLKKRHGPKESVVIKLTGSKAQKCSERLTFNCDQCPFTTIFRSNVRMHKKLHTRDHPHKCEHCTCAFMHSRSVLLHIRRVHPEFAAPKLLKSKPLKKENYCTICDKKFRDSVSSHRKISHPNLKPFPCEECSYETADRGSYYQHRKHHRNKYEFQCPHCTASYETISRCNLHIKKYHAGAEFLSKRIKSKESFRGRGSKKNEFISCQYCSKMVRAYIHKRHEAQHTLPFKCDFCPKRFAAPSELKYHIRKKHHNSSKGGVGITAKGHNRYRPIAALVKCPVCEESIRSKIKFYQHLKLIHPLYKAYKCKDCPFSTANYDAIKSHNRIHIIRDMFNCPYCTASFARIISRANHIKQVHPGMELTNPGVQPELKPRQASVHEPGYYNPKEIPLDIEICKITRKCRICEESIEGRPKFEKHFIDNHPGFKPYQCENCPFSAVYLPTMQKHNTSHTENNAFKCDQCSASFDNLNARTRHIRVHQTEIIQGVEKMESCMNGKTDKNEIHDFAYDVMEVEEKGDSKIRQSCTFDDGTAVGNIHLTALGCPALNMLPDRPTDSLPDSASASPSRYMCVMCNKSFQFKIGLKIHTRKIHNKELEKEIRGVGSPVNPPTSAHPLNSALDSDIDLPSAPLMDISESLRDEIMEPVTTSQIMTRRQSKIFETSPKKIFKVTSTPNPARRSRIKIFVCSNCKTKFTSKQDFEKHSGCDDTRKTPRPLSPTPPAQETPRPMSPTPPAQETPRPMSPSPPTQDATQLKYFHTCPFCQLLFQDQDGLRFHLEIAHGANRVSNTWCNIKSERSAEFDDGMPNPSVLCVTSLCIKPEANENGYESDSSSVIILD